MTFGSMRIRKTAHIQERFASIDLEREEPSAMLLYIWQNGLREREKKKDRLLSDGRARTD